MIHLCIYAHTLSLSLCVCTLCVCIHLTHAHARSPPIDIFHLKKEGQECESILMGERVRSSNFTAPIQVLAPAPAPAPALALARARARADSAAGSVLGCTYNSRWLLACR